MCRLLICRRADVPMCRRADSQSAGRSADKGAGGLSRVVTAAAMIAETGSPPAVPVAAATSLVLEEATMVEHFVWMTTRQIKPGTLADFETAWRPEPHPEGMLRAYVYWSEDEREIVGVSFWDSRDSCETWRASEAAARRHEAMQPYVLEEKEAFYRGRELIVPAR